MPGLTRHPQQCDYATHEGLPGLNKLYCVYIMTNHKHGTLYTGVSSDLRKRAWEHKQHLVEGFTKTHSLGQLVWYEAHEDIHEAITREKRIKRWRRQWKIELIEAENLLWSDLYDQL